MEYEELAQYAHAHIEERRAHDEGYDAICTRMDLRSALAPDLMEFALMVSLADMVGQGPEVDSDLSWARVEVIRGVFFSSAEDVPERDQGLVRSLCDLAGSWNKWYGRDERPWFLALTLVALFAWGLAVAVAIRFGRETACVTAPFISALLVGYAASLAVSICERNRARRKFFESARDLCETGLSRKSLADREASKGGPRVGE